MHEPTIPLRLVLTALCIVAGPRTSRAEPWRQYGDPAQAGFSPEKLEEARQFADAAGSTAIVAVFNGKVIAAWGEVERPCEIHSVRKSIFSGLFGIHVSAGTIDLNATLEQLGMDDEPPLTAEEKKAKVVDMLRSRSGVYHTAAKEPADMKRERPARGSHGPGGHFWYNNWDFNTLGPILEKATGRKVGDDLYQRIVTPLGMEDFRPEHAGEQLEPSYSIHPAYDFRISARDLARYGQLFLQKGRWNGTQIVPESWIAASTSLQTTFPDRSGHGYMWWVHPKGSLKAESGYTNLSRYDMFSARGTGGQFLLVVPGADLVFAHTADTEHNRRVSGPKVWRIAEMILSARTGEPSPSPALVELGPIRFSNPPPPIRERTAIALDAAKLQAYVGEYVGESQMYVRVFVFEERLFANLRGEGEAELFAESDTDFFVKVDGSMVRFLKDDGGVVTAAQLDRDGQTTTLSRVR